jgi:leader peptidase (prepilin peptidase)/N-methyltransferase
VPATLAGLDLVQGAAAHVLAGVLGALLGSFANVCIVRMPRDQSIVRPGSHCFDCGAPVRWFDNLPVISYFVLGGKCRSCGAPFSPRYLLVEVGVGLVVLAAYHAAVAGPGIDEDVPLRLAHFGAHALFLLALTVVTFIDLAEKQIPDAITIPGIPVFFAFGVFLGDRPMTDLILGVLGSYGAVGLLGDTWYFLTGRDALGLGDAKLLALIGALLGWQASLFSLFGGAVVGSLLLVPVLLVRRLRSGAGPVMQFETPFGPFLAAAAVVYLFVGPHLELAWRP